MTHAIFISLMTDAEKKATETQGKVEEAEKQAQRKTAETEERAAEAEERAKEAERQAIDIADVLRQEAQTLKDTYASLLEERGETEYEGRESEKLASLLRDNEREIELLKEALDHARSEKEALLRDVALDRYKAVEVEREKWEALEGRLVEHSLSDVTTR